MLFVVQTISCLTLVDYERSRNSWLGYFVTLKTFLSFFINVWHWHYAGSVALIAFIVVKDRAFEPVIFHIILDSWRHEQSALVSSWTQANDMVVIKSLGSCDIRKAVSAYFETIWCNVAFYIFESVYLHGDHCCRGLLFLSRWRQLSLGIPKRNWLETLGLYLTASWSWVVCAVGGIM